MIELEEKMRQEGRLEKIPLRPSKQLEQLLTSGLNKNLKHRY
jgi:hypothetical protein